MACFLQVCRIFTLTVFGPFNLPQARMRSPCFAFWTLPILHPPRATLGVGMPATSALAAGAVCAPWSSGAGALRSQPLRIRSTVSSLWGRRCGTSRAAVRQVCSVRSSRSDLSCRLGTSKYAASDKVH